MLRNKGRLHSQRGSQDSISRRGLHPFKAPRILDGRGEDVAASGEGRPGTPILEPESPHYQDEQDLPEVRNARDGRILDAPLPEARSGRKPPSVLIADTMCRSPSEEDIDSPPAERNYHHAVAICPCPDCEHDRNWLARFLAGEEEEVHSV